jgi:hypothetical protein
VDAVFERDAGDVVVERVRERAVADVDALHGRPHGALVVRIERDTFEARVVFVVAQETGERAGRPIGQADESDVGVLQQVERAGGALQPAAEYQHAHRILQRRKRRRAAPLVPGAVMQAAGARAAGECVPGRTLSTVVTA